MKKQHYGVIGHPIGHTMSPFIHTRLFRLSGIDADYSVFDIDTTALDDRFRDTLSKLNGFNITIPHKQNIIHCLDEIDDRAKMYGSVNTVLNKDGFSKGFTTDPDGFLMACRNSGIEFEGRIVMLGCGGVARTIAYETALMNRPFEIRIRPEDRETAEKLINELKENVEGAEISLGLINDTDGDIDLLINATPIGMYPNISAQIVDDRVINRTRQVFDCIYNPLETVLVQKAKANGANAAGGMSMLVYQAVAAQQHWNDVSFDRDDIDRLCTDSAQELKNK